MSDSVFAGFGLALPGASSGEFFDAAQDGRGERRFESSASTSLRHKRAAVGQRKSWPAQAIMADLRSGAGVTGGPAPFEGGPVAIPAGAG